MPRVAYTDAQKAEAVALGRMIGAEAAAQQLGIGDWRSVRKWMGLAGEPPELAGSADVWQRARDLAQARLQRLMTEGRLTAVQLATIAGIAERQLRELARPAIPEEPEEEPESPGDAARHRVMAWLDTLPDGRGRIAERYLHRTLQDELKRRREAAYGGENAEPPELPPEQREAHIVEAWARFRREIEEHFDEVAAWLAESEAREAARSRQIYLAGRFLTDDECDLLIAAEAALEEMTDDRPAA